jgi:hypothetical protein
MSTLVSRIVPHERGQTRLDLVVDVGRYRRRRCTYPTISLTRFGGFGAAIVSAEDRQPRLRASPVDGALHYRAHVRVGLRDVGIVTEFGGDVDRLEHL